MQFAEIVECRIRGLVEPGSTESLIIAPNWKRWKELWKTKEVEQGTFLFARVETCQACHDSVTELSHFNLICRHLSHIFADLYTSCHVQICLH